MRRYFSIFFILIIYCNAGFANNAVSRFIFFNARPLASMIESTDLIWTAQDDEVSVSKDSQIIAARQIYYGITVRRGSSGRCGPTICRLRTNENTRSGKEGILREFIKRYNEFHGTNFNVLVNYHFSSAWIWNSSPLVPRGTLEDGRLTGTLLEIR